MIFKPSISELTGVWFIPNPDRGEILPDDLARLLIGGQYRFFPDGSVNAETQLRDRDGKVYQTHSKGIAGVSDDGRVHIDFEGGHSEVYLASDQGILQRVTTTGRTLEQECTLSRIGGPRPTKPAPAKTTHGVTTPIFLNTMPKSGSIYISRWLAHSLNLREMKVAVCLFPDDLIIRDQLDEFSHGNTITQQHIPAKDINLRFLASRIDKLVIHVRDPRQATLSWVHHLDNLHAYEDSVPACQLGLEAVSPRLPDDYFSWSFERRLDYQIQNHLPQLLEWTDLWVAAAQNSAYGLDLLFTTYESFLDDSKKTLTQILEHFDIPLDVFDWSQQPQKTIHTHFRKGTPDEWKHIFSPEQSAKATHQIPPHLLERFGWK